MRSCRESNLAMHANRFVDDRSTMSCQSHPQLGVPCMHVLVFTPGCVLTWREIARHLTYAMLVCLRWKNSPHILRSGSQPIKKVPRQQAATLMLIASTRRAHALTA